MIGKLLSGVASMKSVVIAMIIAFTIGTVAGAVGFYRFYTYGEINKLKGFIESQSESHKDTVKILAKTHEKNLKIANDSVRIKKVIEYVKDDRLCDVSHDAEQLLDNSRTGMPLPTGRAYERLSRLAAITQRQQIESCARDGLQYRKLKVNYDGLREFIRKNWKPP